MKIIDFDFDSELLKRFLEFPRELYASDSNWIPDPAERRLLSGSEFRSTVWRNFVALDGDQVCGRITAIFNPCLGDGNNHYGQLGFFECINDLHVGQQLLESAIHWLHSSLPANGKILAPMNFDTWHSYRFRTTGFDEPTFFMEPYNPSYYPSLFTTQGFRPISRYVTKTVTDLAPLLAFWEPYHQGVVAKGFTVRSFHLDAVTEEMSLIYRLSSSMFRENLFFTDISEAEFGALYRGATVGLAPDLFLFLLDPSGEPVGLSFSLADHRQPKTVNVKTFGVLPPFRYEGIGAAFAYEIYSRFQTKGFVSVNHCLMRAGNRADHFDGGLGRITRAYTLFTRPLEL